MKYYLNVHTCISEPLWLPVTISSVLKDSQSTFRKEMEWMGFWTTGSLQADSPLSVCVTQHPALNTQQLADTQHSKQQAFNACLLSWGALANENETYIYNSAKLYTPPTKINCPSCITNIVYGCAYNSVRIWAQNAWSWQALETSTRASGCGCTAHTFAVWTGSFPLHGIIFSPFSSIHPSTAPWEPGTGSNREGGSGCPSAGVVCG